MHKHKHPNPRERKPQIYKTITCPRGKNNVKTTFEHILIVPQNKIYYGNMLIYSMNLGEMRIVPTSWSFVGYNASYVWAILEILL